MTAVGQVTTLVIDREQFLAGVGGARAQRRRGRAVARERLAADAALSG